MGLLRHSARSESHAGERRRPARGAWYPDPFGVGDERWWDGGRWTGQVRSSAEAARAALMPDQPPNHGSLDGSCHPETAATPGAGEPRASVFPVRIETVEGEQLSVVPSPRKPGMHCHVLTARGRVGSISMFGREMARLACAHGAWFLKKSGKDPQGFRIESADHKQAGQYLRHQWRRGGTIRLIDGTELELRRSIPGRWKVRSADGSRCLAEVRRVGGSAQSRGLSVTIHSLPADATEASMVILAACAVLMLPAAAG